MTMNDFIKNSINLMVRVTVPYIIPTQVDI